MNTQLLRYAVEVARAGSISKAAENLYMNQPNLSKAIKELEASVGVTIFRRTTKGISSVTEEGRVFIDYAKSILAQLDDMRAHFSSRGAKRLSLRVAIPRASYIADAFADFVGGLDGQDGFYISFQETGALRAIARVAEENYDLAVIRYREPYENYLLSLLREKGLESTTLMDDESLILTSACSQLAQKPELTPQDLAGKIEIVNDDFAMPRNMSARQETLESTQSAKRQIYVSERGSQFDLLSRVGSCYMWVSPMPRSVLERNTLVQRRCGAPNLRFKDVLVRRQGHAQGEMERAFLEKLDGVREQVLKDLQASGPDGSRR